ncbi:hypothetical protein DSO57_1001748 [Entomophthora muscae]|uniref:Uncharacterized protein n=1 Tax=Entomophthora muscae TaxID=34485 RepID=A0ACC2SM12_9FUNG|nr:hypothetical protein DSO57_1001748 [Entomophthora muscae]
MEQNSVATVAVTDLGHIMEGQKLLVFKGVGFKDWFHTYENYCNKFSISDKGRLLEVGFYVGSQAGKWHDNQSFDTWDEWKTATVNQFDSFEGDTLDQLNAIRISEFAGMCKFLTKL